MLRMFRSVLLCRGFVPLLSFSSLIASTDATVLLLSLVSSRLSPDSVGVAACLPAPFCVSGTNQVLGPNAAEAEKLFAGEPETSLIASILWAFEVSNSTPPHCSIQQYSTVVPQGRSVCCGLVCVLSQGVGRVIPCLCFLSALHVRKAKLLQARSRLLLPHSMHAHTHALDPTDSPDPLALVSTGSFQVPSDAFRLGKTRVFFRAGQISTLQKILNETPPEKGPWIFERLQEALANRQKAKAAAGEAKVGEILLLLADQGSRGTFPEGRILPREQGCPRHTRRSRYTAVFCGGSMLCGTAYMPALFWR